MQMRDFTPLDCLAAAERIERLAQRLYAMLGDRTRHWPLLQQLFLRLSAEEEQHALRIQTFGRHALPAEHDPEVANEVGATLASMAEELEGLIVDLSTRPDFQDSGEILRLVAGFESRFADLHSERLAKLFAPEVRRLFAALAAQDRQHVELLEHAPV
jgi:rubrerythrin